MDIQDESAGRHTRMEKIRASIEVVGHRLDALCELLAKANGETVHAVTVHVLLEPLRDELIAAACALNDALPQSP